jgi:hypothetical protein
LPDKLYTYYRREGSIQTLRRQKKFITTLDAFHIFSYVYKFLEENNLYKEYESIFCMWCENIIKETFLMIRQEDIDQAISLLKSVLSPIRLDILPKYELMYCAAYQDANSIKTKINSIKEPKKNLKYKPKKIMMEFIRKAFHHSFRQIKKFPIVGSRVKNSERTFYTYKKAAERNFDSLLRLEHMTREILSEDINFYAATKYKGISGISPESENALIVSLTTYPARIDISAIVIFSLLRQSKKPDALILWLAEEQFPNRENDLPEVFTKLKEMGLSICWCKHDIKSFKKLVPVLDKYPNANIITADDDIFYPPDWISHLWNAHLAVPTKIVAYRVRRLQKRDNQIMPYNKSFLNIPQHCTTPSVFNLPTTGGGALFPPNSLYKDVTNEELFKKLTPHADDIWFWAMAILADQAPHWVQSRYSQIISLNSAELRGANTLAYNNLYGDGNDKQIKAVINFYPELRKKLGLKD